MSHNENFLYFNKEGHHVSSEDAGAWNKDGYPDYLIDREEISTVLIQKIESSLPERKPVPKYNPHYLENKVTRNLYIIKDGTKVYVSFIDEGAGYRNVFGYYTYPIDLEKEITEPQDLESIKKTMRIVFPNASKKRKGGSLIPGDTVFLGSFPAGTGIGWFLIPDGWNRYNSVIKSVHKDLVYSDAKFNTDKEYVQTVILSEIESNDLILGFEDIIRNGGDHDFNDLVLKIRCDPYDGIYRENILQLNNGVDVDNSKLIADKSGLYWQFTDNDLEKLTNKSTDETIFQCTQKIRMPKNTKRLREVWEYFRRCNKINVTKEYYDEEEESINCEYRFKRSEIMKYRHLLRQVDNIDDEIVLDNDMTRFECMTFLEAEYIREPEKEHELVFTNLDTNESVSTKEDPQIYLDHFMVWGDPHVRTVDGHEYTLPHIEGTFQLLKNKYIDIRAIMSLHEPYTDHHDQVLRESTYFRKIGIKTPDANVIIDLYDMIVLDNSDKDGKHIVLEKDVDAVLKIEKELTKFWCDYERDIDHLRVKITSGPIKDFAIDLYYMPHMQGYISDVRFTSGLSSWVKNSGCLITESDDNLIGEGNHL